MAKSTGITTRRRVEGTGTVSTRRAELLTQLQKVGREQSNATVMLHAAIAEKAGLGPTEEKVLDLLDRHGALSHRDLVRHTSLAPASITGVLDRLQAKNLILRRRDPQDRRRVLVELDTAHAERLRVLFQGLASRMASVYERYTDDELKVVLRFLEDVTEAQKAAAAELPSPLPDNQAQAAPVQAAEVASPQ